MAELQLDGFLADLDVDPAQASVWRIGLRVQSAASWAASCSLRVLMAWSATSIIVAQCALVAWCSMICCSR